MWGTIPFPRHLRRRYPSTTPPGLVAAITARRREFSRLTEPEPTGARSKSFEDLSLGVGRNSFERSP